VSREDHEIDTGFCRAFDDTCNRITHERDKRAPLRLLQAARYFCGKVGGAILDDMDKFQTCIELMSEAPCERQGDKGSC
jgi:hypothetical protein